MASPKARAAKAPAAPDPYLPEHDTPDPAEWRRDDARVAWWRAQLRTRYGRELSAMIRAARPKREVTAVGTNRESSDEMLGKINGYDELRHFLFVILATPIVKPVTKRRPGEPPVEPHPVSI